MNAAPLLPSQHSTALDYHVEEHIDALTGVDSSIASQLYQRANRNSLQHHNRYDGYPVLLWDYLRVREDDTLALHPVVCQAVPARYHDRLLEDLITTYLEQLRESPGPTKELEPVPGFPEPALDGLNAELNLARRTPYFQLEPGVVSDCDGREYRRASDYPIQLHDLLADLRTRGIVTNLAKTGCDYCGHAAGKEHATQLRDRGLAVRGYAGIAANSHPEDPRVSIQDFDWSDWDASDVRELVVERANAHNFQSKIRIEQAETLKH